MVTKKDKKISETVDKPTATKKVITKKTTKKSTATKTADATKKQRHLSAKGLEQIFGSDGKALSALLNDIESDGSTKETDSAAKISKIIQKPVEIEIGLITSNPYQPRRHFNRTEIINLSESLQQHGLIQPIIIAKNADENFVLVAGERRLKAAQQLRWKKIPALVINVNDRKLMEFSLIENLQRSDLNAIEEAIAYEKLMTRLHYTQEQLAARMSKSRSHIANTLRLLELPRVAQNLVLQGTLSVGQIRPLIPFIKTPQIFDRAMKEVLDKHLNARQVEELAQHYHELANTTPKRTKAKKELSSELSYAQDLLREKLATKVTMKPHKIEIYFSNTKNLNQILETLQIIEK